jgi:DnaK suppressor protein
MPKRKKIKTVKEKSPNSLIKSLKSLPKHSTGGRTVFRTSKAVALPKKSDERPLTDGQVQKFREILTRKRDDLLAVVQRIKSQDVPVDEAEIGDEADIATRSVEKEMLFELTDSEKQTLDMVEAALRKIEKGVFGRCESCLKLIPRLRLEVMPWARYCIHCQAEQEVPAPPPAPEA